VITSIPQEVQNVSLQLEKAGYTAYLVGGCVRDLIMKREPKDWDLTTNATPEQILEVFPDSFYENTFGTVGVKTRSDDPRTTVVEVTPYRIEGTYSDNRHPDTVSFGQKLDEDLERRDFTINAIAYSVSRETLIDVFQGQEALKSKVIQSVGDANKRFQEDALRMLRAIRFSAELNFAMSHDVLSAITANKDLLDSVSRERVRDEFVKILMSPNPMVAMSMLEKLGILHIISPIFLESVGVEQNKQAHKYTVWEHLLRSMQHAADKGYPLEVRMAALFHDIAKPRTKEENGGKTSFYNHEVVGATLTKGILEDLNFSRETIKSVIKFVRWHMFFSDTEEITLSAVRRLIAKVGKERIWDLINLRICDRIGSGRPKEEPYRLRKFKAMIDEVIEDPISVAMLKIDGNTIMQELHVKPSREIGYLLHALLEEVIEDPAKNTPETLLERTKVLLELPAIELRKLGEMGKERLDEEEEGRIKKIQDKNHV